MATEEQREYWRNKSRKWYRQNKEKGKKINLKAHRKVREDTIRHYGGRCTCCGEDNIAFLCIDHINGGGGQERQHLKKHGGAGFCFWLRKNGYPNEYQVLCYNCNNAEAKYGRCPHKSS